MHIARIMFQGREIRLSELGRQIDIPDCGCPIQKRPFCVVRRSRCELREQTGDCECPYLPGPPCEHVLELGNRIRISDQDFLALIRASDPEEYRDLPISPCPAIMPTRDMRVAIMAKRVAMGFSPFRNGDQFKAKIKTSRARNGSIVEEDIIG